MVQKPFSLVLKKCFWYVFSFFGSEGILNGAKKILIGALKLKLVHFPFLNLVRIGFKFG